MNIDVPKTYNGTIIVAFAGTAIFNATGNPKIWMYTYTVKINQK